MKKLSKTILKLINGILAVFLGLLGFSSCEKMSPDMYGCPHADYIIKGKVLNKTDKPIPGIEVCSPLYEGRADTLYTDKNGEFTYRRESLPDKEIPLFFSDIDGDANGGNFAPDSTNVSFKGVKLEGGDGDWYEGKAEKEVTIKLKEKNENE